MIKKMLLFTNSSGQFELLWSR